MDKEKERILQEAYAIYENARDYYRQLRADPNCSNGMFHDAERGMIDAYDHYLRMRYEVGLGTLD